MCHNTLILGDLDRPAVDVLARDGRATPRYTVHTPREGGGGRTADRGWTEIVIAEPPFAAWRADDLDAPTRLVEALTRTSSLVWVSPGAVEGFLGFAAEAQIPALLSRAGHRLSLVFGADGGADVSGLAAPLWHAGAADVVAVWPARPYARSVAPLVLDPRLRRAVDSGRMQLPDCLFTPYQSVALALDIPRSMAVKVLGESVERVSAFRGAIWPGDDSPMGRQLVAQANELRIIRADYARTMARSAERRREGRSAVPASPAAEQADLGEGRPSLPVDDRNVAEIRAMLLDRIARTGASRAPQPKLLEAPPARPRAVDGPFTVKAMVPYLNARTGVEDLAALDPAAADGLSPPRRAAPVDRGSPGFIARVRRFFGVATSPEPRVRR